MDDLNFDGYENIVSNNFYKDDFAYMNINCPNPDGNGNQINLFPPGFEDGSYFDSLSDDSENFDFI